MIQVTSSSHLFSLYKLIRGFVHLGYTEQKALEVVYELLSEKKE